MLAASEPHYFSRKAQKGGLFAPLHCSSFLCMCVHACMGGGGGNILGTSLLRHWGHADQTLPWIWGAASTAEGSLILSTASYWPVREMHR